MASTPKRRKRSKGASANTSDGHQIPPTAGMPQGDQEEMIRSCMASILPSIEDSFRRYMADYHSRSSQTQTNPSTIVAQLGQPQSAASDSVPSETVPTNPPLFQEITAQGNPLPEQAKEGDSHPATGLTLGVDIKIRAKIHANEFVKFATLLPNDLDYEETEKYKSVDKDGQLIFVKTNEKGSLKTINKWIEAFHIFVAIYAEKFPHEIGKLMTYAHTVQKIADSCGDRAALLYDEKFRRWREKEPSSCAWDKKNIELYQEALVLGLDFKLKSKKQPFRAQSKQHSYCYSYNNLYVYFDVVF
ncbi:uncharacterized protein LOC133192943 [Saccostrea echinata]|uniref:uncharacterized protein LOC133192943 n=1 Tax=Saccostrea echinata TaxID=191078 RepID=UPI002A82929B|nr:uncharacterized protein LOC133192943 [Saccostrea echinata]XP_061184940.1 uncharacterized protein LOC133192943 [Saccostrea echinata]